MIITIGIAILTLGVGLFIGASITKSSNNNVEQKPSIFSKFIERYKENREIKRVEAEQRRIMEVQARMEALSQMKPELVKHMMEQERKKLTGEDKTQKLEKFANMFKTGSSGFNAEQKLNNMMGVPQQPQQPQYNPMQPLQSQQQINRATTRQQGQYQQPQQAQQQQYNPMQQQPNTSPMNKLSSMLGGMGGQNNNMNFGSNNTFGEDKINMMLGKTPGKKTNKPQSAEDKIKNFLG